MALEILGRWTGRWRRARADGGSSSGGAGPEGRSVGRASPAGEAPREVLELRVHGVNNTPPHALLELPVEGVVQVAGDRLGSFWRPTVEASARTDPASPGHVPRGIEREAYSWGGLARTSPGSGTGTWQVVVGAVARTGWALLLPFGLVTVAFWSRRLDLRTDPARGWQDDRSAAALRVFAAGLTLLLVGTVSVVGVDLVAHQCFAGGERRCAFLPAALDGLASLTTGQRLVAGTMLPLAALGLLVALATISRARYEQLAALPTTAPHDGGPAIGAAGFWANARLTSTLGRVHVAAALLLLVVATAWHQVAGTGRCATPAQLLGSQRDQCWDRVLPLAPTAVPFAITGALALLGLVGVALLLLARGWGDAAVPGDRPVPVVRRARSLLLAAGALLLTHLVLLAVVDHPTPPQPLLGLVATPTVIVLGLLAIAVRARWWRRDAAPASRAWHGRAPSVFLLLALGTALTLSSTVVVAAGDWLNGAAPAGELLRVAGPLGPGLPDRDACVTVCPVPQAALRIPSVYLWFAVATAIAVGVVLLLGALAALRVSRDLPVAGPISRTVRRDGRPGGVLDELVDRPGAASAVRRGRRLAGMAHRAEPITGVLAQASGVTTTAALAWAVSIALVPQLGPPQLRGLDPVGRGAQLYAWVVDTAAWGTALVGVAVVAGMVGGAALGRARPLGLAWDLLCLLPRTGHPFGPPCYAERVVPELVRRYADWLDAPTPADGAGRRARRAGVPVDRSRRRLVVSAHSLGAVLTVASLFAARTEHGPGLTDRISLLTHGTQLRPYFGRMFPELFGPDVLGCPPCHGARLLAPDPWAATVAADATAPDGGDLPRGPLPDLLTGSDGRLRWVNLWRRTDYLGFPAVRHGHNRVDRAAEEIDTSGYLPVVATHSGYPRSGTYVAALVELAAPGGSPG